MDKDIGKPAYTRYGNHAEWKTYNDLPMPTWENLNDAVRGHWNEVGRMVFEYPPIAGQMAELQVLLMISDVLDRSAAIRDGLIKTSHRGRYWSVVITDIERIYAWLSTYCMVESLDNAQA